MYSKPNVKVFVFLDHYLPGYKAGGPLQTIANMSDRLGDRIDFWIFTKDRDSTETIAYPDVKINCWNRVGKAMVYYASPENLSFPNIQRLIKELAPNIIYLNSFFSTLSIRFLVLRYLGVLPRIPVILAPRGEFSRGALGLKATKKRLYLALIRRIGLYQDLIWQASASPEAQDIRRVIGRHSEVHVIPDMPPRVNPREDEAAQKPKKIPGQVLLVFLSRISPKKNLRQILEILSGLSGQIILDIYGPVQDLLYWRQCQETIAHMPSNVRVTYSGSLPHAKVEDTLSQYHFFLLPTLGENFGHAILEALAAGCPVLISDQTPWQDLAAKHAGWDVPLNDLARWRAVLQHCVDVDDVTYRELSQSARQIACQFIAGHDIEQKTVALFTSAVESQACMASQAS